MAAHAKSIDWEAVEVQYRAGIRSLKDIGAEFGVSDAGIIKRAKRHGWVRDLKAKIIAKAEAKVRAAAVSEKVSERKAQTEQTVVEANAELQFRIRMEHRQDIGRARTLFGQMLGELEVFTDGDGQALIERLQAMTDPPDANESPEAATKRVAAMRKRLNELFALSGRIDSGKKLVEILEKVVKLEREAFGITAGEGQSPSELAEALKGITLNFIEPNRA